MEKGSKKLETEPTCATLNEKQTNWWRRGYKENVVCNYVRGDEM